MERSSTESLSFSIQNNQFGFILQNGTNKEVFFHYEDIKNNKCPKKILRQADKGCIFKVSYQVKYYFGKKKDSYKAINIKIESMEERI